MRFFLVCLLAAVFVACEQPEERSVSQSSQATSVRLLAPGVVSSFDTEAKAGGFVYFAVIHAGGGKDFVNRAALFDANGETLYTWGVDVPKKTWYFGQLLSDGQILIVDRNHALRLYDKNSREVGSLKLEVHHDVRLSSDGNFYTLTKGLQATDVKGRPCKLIHNSITTTTPDLRVLKKLELLPQVLEFVEPVKLDAACDLLDTTQLSSKAVYKIRDVAHSNSAVELPESIVDVGKKGDWLVSFKFLDLLAVFDRETGVKKWWVKGLTATQHNAVFSSAGSILVFDNREKFGRSRVVEIDPGSKTVQRSFDGAGFRRFATGWGGAVEELAPQHWLVSVAQEGRAFELSPTNKVLWHFRLNGKGVQSNIKQRAFYRFVPIPINSPLLSFLKG